MPFESASSTSETSSVRSELATPRSTPSPTFSSAGSMKYQNSVLHPSPALGQAPHVPWIPSNRSSPSSWVSEASGWPDSEHREAKRSQKKYRMGAQEGLIPYHASLHQDEYLRATDEGRRIMARGASPYGFPCDRIEQERLDKQHNLCRLALGTRYSDPLDNCLRRDFDEKSILDIGTGTGIWAISIANEHPGTQVLGVDTVPIQSRSAPSNCHFQICDVNDGLPFPDNTFDIVHMRFAESGIISHPFLMVEITRVLRPNGVFMSLRTDPFRYGPVDPSAIRHFRDAYNHAMEIKRYDIGAKKENIVRESGGFGNFCRALYGVARSGPGTKHWGLKVVEEETLEVAIGVWQVDPFQRMLGSLNHGNTIRTFDAAKAVIVESRKFSQAEVDHMERCAVMSLERNRLTQRIHWLCAVKS